MTSQEKAMVEIAGILSGLRIPYMVIGGMANAVWGIARSTVDVDITVWVDDKEIPGFVKMMEERLEVLPGNPEEFVRDKRVLPVKTSNDVKVDIIFGLIPYEKEAIDRAVEREINGESVMFCTAEDLVLHKIISDREQDILDVKRLIEIRKGELDREYLDTRVRELADMLERPGIIDVYNKAFSD